MKITFEKEKLTKNTVRFRELTASDMDAPKVGTIYVSKAALNELGWTDDKRLTIELGVE